VPTFSRNFTTSRSKLDIWATHGLHLPADYAFHYLPQAALAQGTALQQLIPNPYAGIIKNGSLAAATVQRGQLLMNYPQFIGVTALSNWAGSNYHALTVQVQRHLVKGLSLSAAYTFSTLLDNNLGNGENIYADSRSNTVQYWDNLKAEKAVSTSNQPNASPSHRSTIFRARVRRCAVHHGHP
jgi:hypothetical protein